MPVEIKELRIKAIIAPKQENKQGPPVSPVDLQKFKKEIIQECMEKVFLKLQEKMER